MIENNQAVQGWACPQCRRIWAPSVDCCVPCYATDAMQHGLDSALAAHPVTYLYGPAPEHTPPRAESPAGYQPVDQPTPIDLAPQPADWGQNYPGEATRPYPPVELVYQALDGAPIFQVSVDDPYGLQKLLALTDRPMYVTAIHPDAWGAWGVVGDTKANDNSDYIEGACAYVPLQAVLATIQEDDDLVRCAYHRALAQHFTWRAAGDMRAFLRSESETEEE